MNSYVLDAGVASVAFVGTMFDNYFAYAAQLLVTYAGDEVGLIERHKPSKATQTPWQAYYQLGAQAKLLGSWYGLAGRIQARNAVLEAAGLLS